MEQEQNNPTITFPGALDDTRSLEEKNKDYQAEEVASFSNVEWKEKEIELLPRYEVRDQNGRSSCVAETAALMLGIENAREEKRFVDLSSVDLYSRRANKPGLGMGAYDIMNLAKEGGATLNMFMPSAPSISESEANAATRKESDKQIAQVFKSGGYIAVPRNIDHIASIMEQNRKNGIAKPVMTWYRFSYQEWTGVPQTITNAPQTIHHSVTALDYFMYKGEKALWTQDSWGHNSTPFSGCRILTQSFIEKHMTYAGAFMDLSNAWRDGGEPTIEKPRHTFTKTLRYGEISADMTYLQNILKYEGLFPTEVESTGRYLQITAKAIMEFQKKHKVASTAEIVALEGKVVGPKTRAKLNELYS